MAGQGFWGRYSMLRKVCLAGSHLQLAMLNPGHAGLLLVALFQQGAAKWHWASWAGSVPPVCCLLALAHTEQTLLQLPGRFECALEAGQ